jgi:hypothetical protein
MKKVTHELWFGLLNRQNSCSFAYDKTVEIAVVGVGGGEIETANE